MFPNTQTRLLGILVLAAVVTMGAPLAAEIVLREEVREELLDKVYDASSRYRQRQSASAYRSLQEQILAESKKKLLHLGLKKRDLRLFIADVRKDCLSREKAVESARTEKLALENQSVEEREAIRSLLNHRDLRGSIHGSGPGLFRSFVYRALNPTLADETMNLMRVDALVDVQLQLSARAKALALEKNAEIATLHSSAGDCQAELETLRGELFHLQDEYLAELTKSENAKEGLLLSARELEIVKRDLAEIHKQVLRMQATLARLDEKARRKSERSLIELGIIDGKPGEYSADQVIEQAKKMFRWPVSGPISAGFRDANYRRYFGIPHNGIDIVTPQGTAVHSAAEGVVFVVRDGGETGYTYLLVGHAAGFATLYGHLSEVHVIPGQAVVQGEVLGLSGGKPGTRGAGLTTTGPHVHFELIQGGSNIDPRSVLP